VVYPKRKLRSGRFLTIRNPSVLCILNYYFTFFINNDVLRFQVTVDDIILMEIVHGQDHLCAVKLGLSLCQALAFQDHIEEFPAGTVLQHEEEFFFVLKAIIH